MGARAKRIDYSKLNSQGFDSPIIGVDKISDKKSGTPAKGAECFSIDNEDGQMKREKEPMTNVEQEEDELKRELACIQGEINDIRSSVRKTKDDKIQKLRKQVKEQKEQLRELKGIDTISLSELRNMDELQKQVDTELSQLNVLSNFNTKKKKTLSSDRLSSKQKCASNELSNELDDIKSTTMNKKKVLRKVMCTSKETDSSDCEDPKNTISRNTYVRKKHKKQSRSKRHSTSSDDSSAMSQKKLRKAKKVTKSSKSNESKIRRRKVNRYISSASSSSETDDSLAMSQTRPKKRTSAKKGIKFNGSKMRGRRIKKTISSTSSSSETESTSSDETYYRRSKKYKNKSGIYAKTASEVKFPQKWPHATLQNEITDEKLKFSGLSFSQFVAGELEIISLRKLKKTERNGRLEFLKKLVYYTEMYELKGVLELYAAWVRKVELGQRKWSDDTSEIEIRILTKYIKPNQPNRDESKSTFNKPTVVGETKSTSENAQTTTYTWFCPQYQRNKCTHKMSHFADIRGQMRHCEHICATCWQKDKNKLYHPECSSACPNHEA